MTVHAYLLNRLIEYMSNYVLNTFMCNYLKKKALRGFADFTVKDFELIKLFNQNKLIKYQ